MSEPLTAPVIAAAAEAAAERIAPYTRETPLEYAHALSSETGARVWLKLDNTQVSGSFKARGAFNALLALSSEQRAAGVTTSSTGNHANAMAVAMAALNVEGEIVVPSSASPAKLAGLRAKGAPLRLVDTDPGEAEAIARADAEATGRTYVSPYNDADVIAGQGTQAIEVLTQLAAAGSDLPDAVLVPVGGGGLIAGVAGVMKQRSADIQILGCMPLNSPVMKQSIDAGEIIAPPYEPSLSDATAGWNEPGTITFEPCRDLVDDWILPTEDEIAGGIRRLLSDVPTLAEGAGALSVASLLQQPERFAGRTVVCVVSGSRIPLDVLRAVLG